ncbi:MAG: hypothetical protein MJE63_21660 [Proteobacteria bacterium]|nr:hypothetical protein [Pseudomonadota bacterium]
MLKFYGIRFNHNGAPERFSISFALSESLHAGLHLVERYGGDSEKTGKAIDEEIESLFQSSDSMNNSKHFRFLIAKWFRTRDIVRFLLGETITKSLKVTTAQILDTRDSIKDKWQQIERLVLKYLSRLSTEERNEQLSNPESDINLILQMVGLFFMEQDDEVPPANLELQFIRYQFPKIIWKKKDGFNAASNPFWLPKNMFCRSSYLLARIISKIYSSTDNVEDSASSVRLVQNPISQNEYDLPIKKYNPVSFHALLPEDSPDEIRLELDELLEKNEQLSLIPESAAETLLSLQKMIQRKYSHEGVKHLLGILRQIAGSSEDGHCRFDVKKHLELVAKPSRKGTYSEKQITLFKRIYEILAKIKVKRLWKCEDGNKETVNSFMLELYSECTTPSECGSIKKLMLDPIFLPGKDNPFHLGIHLRLIPPRLFRESASKHALLPGLASYLTGTWLNEYPLQQGKTTKSTREILDGCAFNITPANKYRIIDKLKSELVYMKEKCYISEYSCQQNEEGNPWDDLHDMAASEDILAGIAEKMQVVDANSSSEKLIA